MRARRIWRPDFDTRARLRLACLAEVVAFLRILTTSSSYCAEEVDVDPSPLSDGTSKNSVSPSLRWIVSQRVREGLQVPSPWATTPESTMNTAVFLSLRTPR